MLVEGGEGLGDLIWNSVKRFSTKMSYEIQYFGLLFQIRVIFIYNQYVDN